MKKIMLMAALAVASIVTGCRSVGVVNNGQDYIRNQDGSPVLVSGEPVIYSRGWSVDHFQHAMMTTADSISATVKDGEINFAMNGLNTVPDYDGITKLVDRSLKGAAELAAKIGAAIATSGGSTGADAVWGYVKEFIGRGGDPSKASVSISDGRLTCTDGNCTITGSCTDGSCSE